MTVPRSLQLILPVDTGDVMKREVQLQGKIGLGLLALGSAISESSWRKMGLGAVPSCRA